MDDFYFTPVKILAFGGFACTLLVTYGARHQNAIARLSKSERAPLATETQQKLYKRLSEWIPQVLHCTQNIPRQVRSMLDANEKCKQLVFGAEHATMTIMEYAELGTLSEFLLGSDDLVHVFSEILLFLYFAQVLYGFQHGDLHSKNVVLTTRRQVKIIDFDFSTFYTQNLHHTKHKLGNNWIRPLEIITKTSYTENLIGTVDIWALGIMVLSLWCGGQNIVNRIKKAEGNESYANSVVIILEALLDGVHEKELKPKTIAITNHIRELKDDDADLHEVLVRMLSIYPEERIFNGELYKYFDMAYFQRRTDMNERFKTLLAGILFTDTPQKTTDYKSQVESLIEAGISVACMTCGSSENLFVCSNTGKVVCNIKCWK